MKNTIFKVSLIILLFIPSNLMSNTEYFEEGLILFKNQKLNQYNPKNKRVKDWYALHIHNFVEWVKFSNFAEKNF